MGKSESESSSNSSSYEDESSSEEFEAIDPDELGEEGTRGLTDVLSAVGINIGGKNHVLKDAEGNPIQPVYTERGTYEVPTIVDEQGQVVYQNANEEGSRGLGTVALGAGAIALLGTAAVAATAVGVHYYRKKQKEKKGKGKKKKGKKGKKDKKDKKKKKKKKK